MQARQFAPHAPRLIVLYLHEVEQPLFDIGFIHPGRVELRHIGQPQEHTKISQVIAVGIYRVLRVFFLDGNIF